MMALLQQPDIGRLIFEHTADSHIVELPFGLGEWHLPTGWTLFGIDVSPTRHVVFMALAAVCVFLSVMIAKRSIVKRHREHRAPGGFGTAIEAMVIFVRDDIVLPAMGHGGERYLPYILTLFFFIMFCNFFGLLPWGATATGNIAVTAGLALISFVVIEVSGMIALGPKGYLKTIVMVPPGMSGIGAVAMAFILTPIEIIGKLVKPFALCLRLFANMTGGHFVILSLMGLIFIFGSWLVAGGSVLMILFMLSLELLVALLQAYIFALLTSVFIGMMLHEH